MTLSKQLGLSAVSLILLVTLSFCWLVFYSGKAVLKNQQMSHYRAISQQLANVSGRAVLENGFIFLSYVRDLQHERGFLSAFFVDLNGKVIFHSDLRLVGVENKSFLLPKDDFKPDGVVETSSYGSESGVLDLAAPVFGNNQYLGTAHLWLNEYELDAPIQDAITKLAIRMLFISCGVLLVGMLMAWYFSRSITKPIESVVRGMRDLAENKLIPLPELPRNDELGLMVKELNITIHKLKELEEMKSEFIASITHEFRSPLTAIELLISLFLKERYGPLSSAQHESLLTLRNNVTRLSAFVDNLLTTAKIEAQKSDIYRHDFDLMPMIQDMFKLFKPVAEEKQIHFEIEAYDAEIWVHSDQGKISQILSNLISNALKFTTQGEVRIHIEDQITQVNVSIVDTGPGISEKEQETIFERFYRSPQIAVSTRGTGLGLSIAKSYSDLLGSPITVRSEPDKGSCFSILIPKSLKV